MLLADSTGGWVVVLRPIRLEFGYQLDFFLIIYTYVIYISAKNVTLTSRKDANLRSVGISGTNRYIVTYLRTYLLHGAESFLRS